METTQFSARGTLPQTEGHVVPRRSSERGEVVNADFYRSSRQPKVLVIVTGGTICMTNDGINASLRPTSLVERLEELISSHSSSLPQCDILEWKRLIDSSDMNLSHWVHIATDIEMYEGFVVLHGTDTLAYTAAALSFMLENLSKPVILTGAMLPLYHIQTDARTNFSVALMIAAQGQIAEVCVLFGSRLLRGNRCTKSDCSRMDAFKSPNFPALGSIGVEVRVDERLSLLPSKPPFRVFSNLCLNVVVVTITPGFRTEILRNLFQSRTRPFAVILQLYGSGTAPTLEADLLTTLQDGIATGVQIVAVTQCLAGNCSLLTYESGALYYHLGIIEGKDMTIEATFAKLAYLMGKGYVGDKLRYFMEIDIRGEVTERPLKVTGQASLATERLPNTVPYGPIRRHSGHKPRNHLDTVKFFHWSSEAAKRAQGTLFDSDACSENGSAMLSSDTGHSYRENIESPTPQHPAQALHFLDHNGRWNSLDEQRKPVHTESQSLFLTYRTELLERGPRITIVPKEVEHE